MGYKESPVDEARRRFTARVHQLFSTFFTEHRACLIGAMGGAVDLILPVPSSSRPGRASLERAEGLGDAAVTALGGEARWVPPLLQRSSGAIGHMRPNAQAFVVPGPRLSMVNRSRVLLLDDTYVSGARAQSAAAVLRLSGARAVLIVPLGRVLRPNRSGLHAAFVETQAPGGGHRSRCVVAQADTGIG
jgi:predicted amidophosphoribosyltransferase